MANVYKGLVWAEQTDTGVVLRTITDTSKVRAPKEATRYDGTPKSLGALLERMKGAKAAFAPWAVFIPGVSPEGGTSKSHTVAEVNKAIASGRTPVLCWGRFGTARLMLLEPKAAPERKGGKAPKVRTAL